MMETWLKFSKPPVSALKPIQAGRLKGKSDINPQWRYQAMTEVFGMCGIGWKYEIVRLWTEPASHEQVFAFAEIKLYVKRDERDEWSAAIPAIGGSMLVQKEREGLHSNDEAFKMAVTDALGTAMKMLGVAAEVYLGNWDGSKYKETAQENKETAQENKKQDIKPPEAKKTPPPPKKTPPPAVISDDMRTALFQLVASAGFDAIQIKDFLASFGFASAREITVDKYEGICNRIASGDLKDPEA